MADWFEQHAIPRNTTQPTGTPVRQPTTAPTTPPTTPQQGGDPIALIQQWQSELPPTQASMQEIMRRLQANGIPAVLATHMGGTKMTDDAIVLPDGRVFDLIVGAGGGNDSWGMQHVDNYDPSRNIVGPDGTFMPFRDYLGANGLPMPNLPPFPHKPKFGSPDGVTGSLGAMAGGIDPSYGFRFDEGQKAIEKSAAAKGTLLTGGTLKALTRYGQDMASTEFGNVFDRNYRLAGLGLNAAHGAAQSGTSYGNQTGYAGANHARNQTDLITGQSNVNAANQLNQGGVWGDTIGDLAGLAGDWIRTR